MQLSDSEETQRKESNKQLEARTLLRFYQTSRTLRKYAVFTIQVLMLKNEKSLMFRLSFVPTKKGFFHYTACVCVCVFLQCVWPHQL